MAASLLYMSLAPAALHNKKSTSSTISSVSSPSHCGTVSSLKNSSLPDERSYERRSLLMAAGILALSSVASSSATAQGATGKYTAFVDKADGYSYVYPADWRDFDFRAHDSAFKDRYLQLQNVRLSFIPTDKADVHDLGPMENVIEDLVKFIYAAPNQVSDIKDIQERSEDGRNYYTVEYQLTSPNFSVTRFTTIAIANGRFYTLTVSANERRWRRVRDQLKVVADSFKVFDI